MNLNATGGFESHNVIHSVGAGAQARESSHRRAIQALRLQSTTTRGGFLSRLLSRLRSDERQYPVCRLDDGKLGRLALQQVDGAWVEVCVPA